MSTDPTPDPALVELFARALARSRGDAAFDDQYDGDLYRCEVREILRSDARAVLSALTAAGYQVLPPGGQFRAVVQHMADASADPAADHRTALATAAEVLTTLVGPWQPTTEETHHA